MDLVRIAMRVASRIAAAPPMYKGRKLPTLTGHHVETDEVDAKYSLLPEEVRRDVLKALRMHDSLIQWAGKNLNQEAMMSARGDPIRDFNAKKNGAIREAKNAFDTVRKTYPDANLSGAGDELGSLAQYELPYESMEHDLGVYPYADAWVYYLHDLLSHLLYVAFDAAAPRISSLACRVAFRIF